jgi:Rho GDP-dissociation inhibitor
MSHHAQQPTEDELQATATPGYRPPEARDVSELAQLDSEDQSLNAWKKSLGIVAGGGPGGAKPSVRPVTLPSKPGCSVLRPGEPSSSSSRSG